jgi:hypothetical protein
LASRKVARDAGLRADEADDAINEVRHQSPRLVVKR